MKNIVVLSQAEIIKGIKHALYVVTGDDKIPFCQLISETELPKEISIELRLKPREAQAGEYPDCFGPEKT